LGTDTLRPFATVQGSVDTVGISGNRIFVQVLGLERLASVNADGGFMFSDLPAGLLGMQIVAVNGTQKTVVRSDQVTAVSGDTVPVTMPGWKYSQKVSFNTTVAGANVPGNVINFPALLRLDKSNFDFSSAQANGSDIRFTKANGTKLSFEIEQWDAPNKNAEIWVKIDTIYGNDNAQPFVMFWGASAATMASNSAAVFDTGNGFQGVWHMGQSQGPVLDATVNNYNGTLSDTAPLAATGAIGNCMRFNGKNNFITIPGTANSTLNFPEQGNYSVSAWVFVDTLDTLYAKIIEKNNFQYKLQIDCFKAWSFSEFENGVGYRLTNYRASSGLWVYLVGVRSGASQYLYVNGQCVTNTMYTLSDTAGRRASTDVYIGKASPGNPVPGCYFKGRIDEARIENRARTADWIKLSYMNQNQNDRLVLFK
jgi:hypothetical protein